MLKAKYNELPGSIWAVYAADALNAWLLRWKSRQYRPRCSCPSHAHHDRCKGITGPLMFTERGDRKDIPYYAYIYNDQGKLELYQK
jgi:hypothetical protein